MVDGQRDTPARKGPSFLSGRHMATDDRPSSFPGLLMPFEEASEKAYTKEDILVELYVRTVRHFNTSGRWTSFEEQPLAKDLYIGKYVDPASTFEGGMGGRSRQGARLQATFERERYMHFFFTSEPLFDFSRSHSGSRASHMLLFAICKLVTDLAEATWEGNKKWDKEDLSCPATQGSLLWCVECIMEHLLQNRSTSSSSSAPPERDTQCHQCMYSVEEWNAFFEQLFTCTTLFHTHSVLHATSRQAFPNRRLFHTEGRELLFWIACAHRMLLCPVLSSSTGASSEEEESSLWIEGTLTDPMLFLGLWGVCWNRDTVCVHRRFKKENLSPQTTREGMSVLLELGILPPLYLAQMFVSPPSFPSSPHKHVRPTSSPAKPHLVSQVRDCYRKLVKWT
mmetsp:Transcript_30424/g.78727  ORF Transcript_30424/g.78727 Transcript_30424/m.78727 type:complete len:395 (-) Transcript_30424:3573-4757(-)